MTWAAVGSAAISYAGSQGTAKAQAESAKEANKTSGQLGIWNAELQRDQFEEEKRKALVRQQAYNEMQKRSAGDFSGGEAAFTAEANKALPELEQQATDIQTGANKGMQDVSKQMQLGLAQQGQRGGQAAIALKRGVGEVGQNAIMDINKMKAQEAKERAQERRAYQSGKAIRGQTAGYQAPVL